MTAAFPLTPMILTPLAGALAVLAVKSSLARPLALLCNAFSLASACLLWRAFDPGASGMQMLERHAWFPAIGAEYVLGLDGLGMLLVLLTSIVVPFSLLARRADTPFCALILILQAALYGTFTAQNFILWFLFYEMSLVPAFFLIKAGGGAAADRAAVKFFVYTFVASVGMLLGFLAIQRAAATLDFAALARLGRDGGVSLELAARFGPQMPWLVFAGIFFGLAVKVPLFPFHTWLPDAYANAPAGGSMVMTGLLSKMGIYGFIRLLLPLFPGEAKTAAPLLLTLAICSILFSALAAWAQTDLKRLIAYLSITHLGYCMLGLFAIRGNTTAASFERGAALSGVFMQVFNHGITAAALFYYAGLLEERRGLRGLGDFGGLMQRAPILCGWMSVAIFSSLGLPGLNGFIGEFLIFKGSFTLATAASALATGGLLVTAIALIRTMQALFSGSVPASCEKFTDLTRLETCVAIPVSLLMLAIGVAPQFLFTIFNTTVLEMTR